MTAYLRPVRVLPGRLFWLGLVMVVLEIGAIIFPIVFFFHLRGGVLVGWVLSISGGVALVGSFSIHGTGPFFGALLLGLLSIVAGVFLLFNPLAGAIALTLMVGVDPHDLRVRSRYSSRSNASAYRLGRPCWSLALPAS